MPIRIAPALVYRSFVVLNPALEGRKYPPLHDAIEAVGAPLCKQTCEVSGVATPSAVDADSAAVELGFAGEHCG